MPQSPYLLTVLHRLTSERISAVSMARRILPALPGALSPLTHCQDARRNQARFSDSLTRLHPACVPIGMGGSNLSSKQLVSGRVVHANGDCDRAPYTHGALKVSRRRFRKSACAAPHVRHGIATRTRQWAIQASRLTPTQRPPLQIGESIQEAPKGFADDIVIPFSARPVAAEQLSST
jgi:hypothetical protein